jgi:biotin carboxylase
VKTLLVVSGGGEAVDIARRAKELGCYVVVSDRDLNAPAFAFSDSCLIADASAADETAAAAERFSRKIRKIQGVIAGSDDATTTASVAARLGLLGITSDLASALGDRLATKQRLLAAGIPIPWFSPVATVPALQRIAIERGPKLVIEAVESTVPAVRCIVGAQEMEDAFVWARQHSPAQRVMVEEHLEGPRVFAESLVIGGRCFTPIVADRTGYDDGFAGNGYDLPTSLPWGSEANVKRAIAQAAAALGLSNGAFGCEIVMRGEEPCVTGVTAGLSGVFATRLIPLCTGVDFLGAAIQATLGDATPAGDLEPKKNVPVVLRCAALGSDPTGPGLAEARKLDGIEQISVTPARDQSVQLAGARQPGAVAMVVATGPSREAASGNADRALSSLHRRNDERTRTTAGHAF